MKKDIVVYYSNTGSNEYLAGKISKNLSCPVEAIRPKVDVHPFLLFGINFGIKKLESELKTYDRVILVGPVWMGKFVAPLKSFLKKYKSDINELIFVTCCGSTYENSRKKFGYELVFDKVKALYDGPLTCQAFPITMVMPEEKREDGEAVMKTRLSDANFTGEIVQRYEKFIESIS
jgi:flavodoxin